MANALSVRDMIKKINRKAIDHDEEYDVLEKPPSAEEESSSDDEDDEFSSENEQFGRYMNIPEIVDEVKNFIREEENYCRSLQDLVQNYIKSIEIDKDVYDVFGCIDVISTYHNNTFLPALKSSRNVKRIANCFIINKKLFNVYYDNYFKSKANIVLVLNENKDVFKDSQPNEKYKEYETILLNSIHDRVQTYQEFLESMKTILTKSMDVSNFDQALEIIGNLTKYFSKKNENTRFVMSELVQTERLYLEKVEILVKEMIPIVEKLMKSRIKVDSVVGTIPQIYSKQQSFYEALKRSLYDFNPNEAGDCFIKHKDIFLLYIKDQQMKNNLDAIEECRTQLQKMGKNYELHAPLNRLYKYKLLLHELKKCSEKGNLPCRKVEEALNMIVNIITKMNGVAAINSIKDENIHVNNQGALILRDEFVLQSEDIKCDAMIFLFEKSIVITQAKTEGPRKNRRDAFVYISHIIAKYLAMNACQESPTNLQIQFYGKYSRTTYTLQAKDKSTKDLWVNAINDMLMVQFNEEKERNAYKQTE